MAGLTPKHLESIPAKLVLYLPPYYRWDGQIERVDDWNKVAKYAGLYWRYAPIWSIHSRNTSFIP